MEIREIKEEEYLIIKYNNKNNKFEDITHKVIYLKDFNSTWLVVFKNNNRQNKEYYIKFSDLHVYKKIIEIPTYNKEVYYYNKRNYDIFKIIEYEDKSYKLFMKNYQSVRVNKINIDNNRIYISGNNSNMTGDKVFDYYKELSEYAANISNNSQSIESLLNNLYKKINEVNKDSALYYYTNNISYKDNSNKYIYIYPFDTNISQIKAIDNTFRNKISIISGPPGTGKTQVILNILMSSMINNMKVAVISNNNAAVKNIYDKLNDLGYGFIIAYLGNSENVNSFFSTNDNYNDYQKLKYSGVINVNINSKVSEIITIYEKQNKLNILNQALYEIKKEFEHFQKNKIILKEKYNYIDYNDYNKYLKLKNKLLSIKKFGIFSFLKLKLFYNINLKGYDDELIDYLDYKYYELKINKMELEIDDIKKYLASVDISTKNVDIKKHSINILNKFLYNKYNNYNYFEFNKNNYKNNFDKFMERYPITLSTTHSLLRNCPNHFMYDLVIIDEASQSDIMTTLLPMNICKKIVIVGDDKQLSQIDNTDIYDISEELTKMFNINKCYHYKNNSILTSCLSLPNKIVNTTLKEHYRCDFRIIQFCNKKFYNNELIIYTKTSELDPLVLIHTVEGNHARKNPNGSGQYNDRECQEIIKILEELKEKDVGIISPFNAQVDYINQNIRDRFPYAEVNTIHKYQGRQKKIIILSTVVNNLDNNNNFITDFVTNKELLNVAISRAIEKLYIVVSDKVYKSEFNTIAQFIEYIQYYCNNSDTKGTITSIFDELYKDNYNIMRNSPLAKKVDSVAELLMINLINKVLVEYPDYKLSMHITLSNLVKDLSAFNEEEKKYINNRLTHVDFVIFDKISYKPILCIEVDGTKYHDYSKIQIEHDIIKNKVLAFNGLKLLRLKTNMSKEEEKLKSLLNLLGNKDE